MKTRAKKIEKKNRKEKKRVPLNDINEQKMPQNKDKDKNNDAQQTQGLITTPKKEQTINNQNKKSHERQQNKQQGQNQSRSQEKFKQKYVDLFLTEEQYILIMHFLPKGYSLQSFQSIKKIKHPSITNFPQHTKKIERQVKNIKKIEKQLQVINKEQCNNLEIQDTLVARLRKKTSDGPKQNSMLERKSQRIFLKQKISYQEMQEKQDTIDEQINPQNPLIYQKYVEFMPHNKKMLFSQFKLPEIRQQIEEVIEQSPRLVKYNQKAKQIEIQPSRYNNQQNKPKTNEIIKDEAQNELGIRNMQQNRQKQSLPKSQKKEEDFLMKSSQFVIQLQCLNLSSEKRNLNKDEQQEYKSQDLEITQTRQKQIKKKQLKKLKKIKKKKRKQMIQSSQQDITLQLPQKSAEIQQGQLNKPKNIKQESKKDKRKPKFSMPNIPLNDTFYNEWNILYQLKKHLFGQPFLQPVDQLLDGAKNYYKKIKHPVDLSTIESKLQNKQYKETDQFHLDVDLMFSNSLIFNSKGLMKKITLDFQHFYRSLIPETTIQQIKKKQKMRRKSNKQ